MQRHGGRIAKPRGQDGAGAGARSDLPGRRRSDPVPRFKAIVVEKDAYLLELCRYVVLNPVRAGMVPSAGTYRWSNYRATAGEASEPGFLTVAWTLEQFGSENDRARSAYRRFVAAGKGGASPLDEATGQVFLGRPGFIAEMRRRLEAEAAELSKAIPRLQRSTWRGGSPGCPE